jgi:RNase P protein component
MKRRLREAVRLVRSPAGPDVDVVINPKKVVLSASFEVVVREVRQAFTVIEKKFSVGTGEENRVDRHSRQGGRRET